MGICGKATLPTLLNWFRMIGQEIGHSHKSSMDQQRHSQPIWSWLVGREWLQDLCLSHIQGLISLIQKRRHTVAMVVA